MVNSLCCTYVKKSHVSNSEGSCHCGGIGPSWVVTGLILVSILICLMICRPKVHCGKILAMKLWQAITRMGRGCSFFQVHLLQVGGVPAHCLLVVASSGLGVSSESSF